MIDALLSKILNARYGREVRQSIHDAIKQCYLDTICDPDTIIIDNKSLPNHLKDLEEQNSDLSDSLSNGLAVKADYQSIFQYLTPVYTELIIPMVRNKAINKRGDIEDAEAGNNVSGFIDVSAYKNKVIRIKASADKGNLLYMFIDIGGSMIASKKANDNYAEQIHDLYHNYVKVPSEAEGLYISEYEPFGNGVAVKVIDRIEL